MARTSSSWPKVPVMLITGYVDGARELPQDVPVLQKPFKPRELCGHIDRMLERWSSGDGASGPLH